MQSTQSTSQKWPMPTNSNPYSRNRSDRQQSGAITLGKRGRLGRHQKGGTSAGQPELVHTVAVRANMRSILVAMMKSFSCSPLIFLVCRETVTLPQPKLIFG